MIIGGDRIPVIENIKERVKSGELNAKVELGDPVLSPEEANKITDNYLDSRKSLFFKLKSWVANVIANVGGSVINRNTEIVGEVDSGLLRSGVIITSNHFSPLENTVIRTFVRKNGVKKLGVVSQVTNFAMGGLVGFLMKYTNTIPLSANIKYFARDLLRVIEEKICSGEAILIYPEQEMWFNYRKPRPHREGAYHFASKLNCPIVSCFVEIVDLDELDTIDFYKVKYRLHILGVITPDPQKSPRENCKAMCKADYELKKSAYERIYGKELSYEFKSEDIAGWINYAQVFENE